MPDAALCSHEAAEQQHNQVTEQKNHQAGEVDTGDIFLLIFAPLQKKKKKRGIPPSSFVNIAFRYSPSCCGIACPRLPAVIFKPLLSASYVEQVATKLRGLLHTDAQPIRFSYPLFLFPLFSCCEDWVRLECLFQRFEILSSLAL